MGSSAEIDADGLVGRGLTVVFAVALGKLPERLENTKMYLIKLPIDVHFKIKRIPDLGNISAVGRIGLFAGGMVPRTVEG